MKESGKERLKSTIYESTLSTADAVPLPRWKTQISSGYAANIYGAMPEDLLIAGFPRIASLPLEGKVPRRGGWGTGGMKESGKERLKYVIYESTRAPLTRSHFPDGEGKLVTATPPFWLTVFP